METMLTQTSLKKKRKSLFVSVLSDSFEECATALLITYGSARAAPTTGT